MGRGYNDYMQIPASQVQRSKDPRVRVNGLLNRAFEDSCTVSWWPETGSERDAKDLERLLIARSNPSWNRTIGEAAGA